MTEQVQFVLILDPQTKQFYSFSEQKNILVKQKLPSNKQLSQQIQKQAENDLKVFTKIMKWQTKGQMIGNSSFQKRPIPLGYLAQRKYRYPIFSNEQPIKQATLQQIKLNDDGVLVKGQYQESIQARIYFGSIKYLVEQAKRLYPYMNADFIPKIEIKLITSANQVIRGVCRNILQEYKIVIVTRSEKTRLILKVRNREEYMLGNQPISNYQYVVQCLRQNKTLEIQIFETQINLQKQQYRKFIFNRHLADIQRKQYEGYPWQRLLFSKSCGFLLWYRPDPYFINTEIIQEEDSPQLEKVNRKIKNKIVQKKKSYKTKIPRYILKESIDIFIEKRRKQIQKKLVCLEGSTMFTGECNFAYYLKVVGINNLYGLFQMRNPQNRAYKRSILKLTSSKELTDIPAKQLLTANKRLCEVLKYKQKQLFPILPYQVCIQVQLYHNGQAQIQSSTQNYLVSNIVEFNETIQWKYRLADFTLEGSLVFKVKVFSKQGENIVCGIGALKLFDEYGFLRQGSYNIQLYSQEKVNIIKLGCYHHHFDNLEKTASIVVNLPKFREPVRWTLNDPKSMSLLGYIETKIAQQQINVEEKMQQLIKLLNYNPLRMIKYTKDQQNLLRAGKKFYKHQSDKLINYLYSIDWTKSIQIAEAYQSMKQWTPLKPIEGLFMLTPRLSDEKVRYFAVKVLDKMKNSEFCTYSNQITQALVSFQTHDNPLIDLIIERSAAEPFTIGQEYFWQFWNRRDEDITEYRFNLYLQCLLLTSPNRQNLFKQIMTYKILVLSNAELIQKTENMYFYQKDEHFKSKCKNIEESLLRIDENGFSFPIRPEFKFKNLAKEQCRMFDSKKLPFSLCCAHDIKAVKSNKQKSYKVMFKCGDDIKQDHLILQILSVFNKLWIDAGYDLKMNIYRVLSTDTEIGFIEIVDDAENSSKIHKDHSDKIMQALDDHSTLNYLKKHNRDEKSLKIARQNFIRSSAAYLVATYVLGIGDRHSGNYMVQKNGKFFHIDFGHILGNFKMKLGVKRERTPFVFTSEFAFVMDGQKSKHFARFERYCTNAYNVLRKNSNLIINLMAMMVGADIPQLQKYQHIEYMITQLKIELSQHQAQEHLIKQIKKTLESQSRKYDNFFHEKMRFG